METLKSKVALVTGGSRGIGLAIARALMAEGAQVAITGKSAAHLSSARPEIERAGPGKVETLQADVRLVAEFSKLCKNMIVIEERRSFLEKNIRDYAFKLLPHDVAIDLVSRLYGKQFPTGGEGNPYVECKAAIEDVSSASSRNGLCTPFPDAMCVAKLLPNTVPLRKYARSSVAASAALNSVPLATVVVVLPKLIAAVSAAVAPGRRARATNWGSKPGSIESMTPFLFVSTQIWSSRLASRPLNVR